MAKMRLSYWNIRGLGERIKLILQYLGLDYEFVPYNDFASWAKDKEEFIKKGQALANLPYLLDGDKAVFQTEAIAVYLCQKAGRLEMLGSTPEEEVRLAQFKGFYSDFVRNFFDFCIGKGDYEEDKAKFKEVAHAKLAKLATFRGTREYMVAAHFTLADLLMFELLSLLGMLFEEDVGKDKYWDEYFHKVRNIPSIKSYRESGRFIKEPVAGPQSRFKPMKMQ